MNSWATHLWPSKAAVSCDPMAVSATADALPAMTCWSTAADLAQARECPYLTRSPPPIITMAAELYLF